MAPEVVGRKGYTWCIDWWSLGVTAYELLFHKRPFDGRSADKMTHSILNCPIRFPADANSKCTPEGLDAIESVSKSNCYTPMLTILVPLPESERPLGVSIKRAGF